ncbi:hypothetical protein EDD18DRAFT_1428343 [Armillaria luteobubalina]|uniref:NACHT domain-containing protein n=1 Tax=Armillaria luteobubalina TaxID=153913 RepID=A0AA39UDP0_9AGAR|nr:hypothetical protein EDD18DRAFT_1428343 [Armillaria luteobubalina]
MAEVLGIASSITALIQNTVTVINYLKDVKNAPKERDKLWRELQYLEICLTALEKTTRLSEDGTKWLKTLQKLDKGIEKLQKLLEGLKKNLKPDPESSWWKRSSQRMLWTISKESVKDDLSKIERFKTLIAIALQHDHLMLTRAIQEMLGDIKDDVHAIRENTTVTRQLEIDGKAKEVAKWLTDLDYNAIQHNNLQKCAKDTREWFLQSSKFRDWVDGSVREPSVLWCVGTGVGKTILAATTVNHLCMKFKEDKTDKAVVFCIFCDYHATDQRTITVICSLLKQLIQARLCLTDGIQDFYNKWSHGGMLPSLEDITSLLSAELKLYSHVYIILDALDELNDDGCHEGVLHALKALGTQISGLTVGHLPALLSKDESLHEKIHKTVVKKADGMFMLAKIHMELLACCINQWQLDIELDKLPGTLEKAYGHLLARINSQPNKDLAYHIFGWVAFAVEPLGVKALQHALAIEPRTKQVDPANITKKGVLLSICAGLVVIDHSRCFKFVHDTQEYFTSQKDKLFPHIHVDFTCICLAYMSANALRHPFSWYSLHHWDFHAHKCSGSSTAKKILAFLDDEQTQIEDTAPPFQEQFFGFSDPTVFAGVVHAVKLLLADPEVNFQHLHSLCLAAYAGNYIMAHFIGMENESVDVNCEGQVPFLCEVPDTSLSLAQKDSCVNRGSLTPFCTPLIAAASNGHQRMVEALLDSKELTSLNAMSSSGLTALSSAIICNSVPVVMCLLQEQDIDTSIQFKGQTPIMLAARYGFDKIVKLFLKRKGDDPNTPGENGKTALHVAVQWNQYHIISFLLKSGRVDVNRKDSQGRTALSIAASLGSAQSVKRLMAHRGINMLAKDNDGKSAYEIAVEERQDKVATFLAEYAAKGSGTR